MASRTNIVTGFLLCGGLGSLYGAVLGGTMGSGTMVGPVYGTFLGGVCGFLCGLIGGSLGRGPGWAIGGSLGGYAFMWGSGWLEVFLQGFLLAIIGAGIAYAIGTDLDRANPWLPPSRAARASPHYRVFQRFAGRFLIGICLVLCLGAFLLLTTPVGQ